MAKVIERPTTTDTTAGKARASAMAHPSGAANRPYFQNADI
jgi:hypothetical protein